MNAVKVLTIGSLPVHGMAGLKPFIRVLGTRILPVPSVLLNGLTNMPGVIKQQTDFKQLLEKSFELILYRKQKVILCISYLFSADQIDAIICVCNQYREAISCIITDPICGDHGKAYVSQDIILRWPELIRLSALTFPNTTELKLITGIKADEAESHTVAIQLFQKRYPDTNLVLTSAFEHESETGVLYVEKGHQTKILHNRHAAAYSGTGDTFLAYFILYHYYHRATVTESIVLASEKVQQTIVKSMTEGFDELFL